MITLPANPMIFPPQSGKYDMIYRITDKAIHYGNRIYKKERRKSHDESK